LGRLGIKYTRDIATAIPEMRLAAVADINSDLAASVAAQYGVPTWTPDPFAMIRNPGVDTVVIASPTAAHRDHTIAALNEGKPTFCEKPPSIVLRDAETMRDAAIKSGTFLQMGFMRRFDRGYAAAKQQLDNGVIGDPVLIKCCSRDPSPPSLAYANPASSGGTIVDMGIHDFDLCRFFVGEVDRVHSIGGAFACPEFATINDVDTAVV
jgi:predicted dehydrogenase